jgi:hypothetical protein
MVENMKKIHLGSNLLMLALLLSVGSCEGCNRGNKSGGKPLKLTITGGKIAEEFTAANKAKFAIFKIEVMEGEDKTDNYKIKLGTLETFKNTDYSSGGAEDADKQVILTAPADGATLESLEIGDSLKKGDKRNIFFTFKSAAVKQSKGSSQIDVSIIDKDGKVVGGPAKLQWNYE